MDGVHNDHQRCICTGQTEHRGEITEDLMDLVGATERQSSNPCNLRQYQKEAAEAGSSC